MSGNWGNKEYVLQEVQRDGRQLQHASPVLQADRDVVLAAAGGWIEIGIEEFSTAELRLAQELRKSGWWSAAQAYKFTMAKVRAGLLRCLAEDLWQGACQALYLVKIWKTSSDWSRAYTIFTIVLGVALSIRGPVADGCKAYALMHLAMKEEALQLPDRPFAGAGHRVAAAPSEGDSTGLLATEGGEVHGIGADVRSRLALILCSLLFWSTVLGAPAALLAEHQCGGSPPTKAMMAFFAMLLVDMTVQAWVVMRDSIWRKAVQWYLKKEQHCGLAIEIIRMFAREVVFATLGKLDVLNDSIFVASLHHCHRKDFTFFTIKGLRLTLPFDLSLQDIALGVLLVGVVLCQAVPAILMLACCGPTFTSLKLNDFGIVIAGMTEWRWAAAEADKASREEAREAEAREAEARRRHHMKVSRDDEDASEGDSSTGANDAGTQTRATP